MFTLSSGVRDCTGQCVACAPGEGYGRGEVGERWLKCQRQPGGREILLGRQLQLPGPQLRGFVADAHRCFDALAELREDVRHVHEVRSEGQVVPMN